MSRLRFASTGGVAALALIACLLPATALGQSAVPDLEGIWTNQTLTLFERPPELAGKPFLNTVSLIL